MNTLEIAPQKQKQFDNRKQDHGDAAEQRGHKNNNDVYENKYDRRVLSKVDRELYRVALQDMNYEQLEAEADKIIAENEEEEDEPESTEYQDYFPKEAELDIKSKHEIHKEKASQATLDPREDDEVPDSTFGSSMRVRGRL